MIEKQFFFLSGLPRSGSTVLASILNQNPEVYVTPTSPLLDLLEYNTYYWSKLSTVQANPIPEQLMNLSEAIINGCWDHIPQKIIIDKCRGWLKYIDSIEKTFNKKPKIIMTVRDIPSILASYMRLLKESKEEPNYIDELIIEKGYWLNDANRVTTIWDYHLQLVFDQFKKYYTLDNSYFLLVEYDDLIENKEFVIDKIYNFLEIPNFKHQFENIKNVTEENDKEAWRLENLHKINPVLKKVAKHPQEILGEDVYNKYKRMNLEFWRN